VHVRNGSRRDALTDHGRA